MSLRSELGLPAQWRYPLHARALERHGAWAREFAGAGDMDAAFAELLDVRAVVAEIEDPDDRP